MELRAARRWNGEPHTLGNHKTAHLRCNPRERTALGQSSPLASRWLRVHRGGRQLYQGTDPVEEWTCDRLPAGESVCLPNQAVAECRRRSGCVRSITIERVMDSQLLVYVLPAGEQGTWVIRVVTVRDELHDDSMTITEPPVPFVVDVPQCEIVDLARRVRDARLPEPIGVHDWSTGVPVSVLRSMAPTWVEDFSWREVETPFASFPQYIVEIDGHRIHYLHVRSSRADSTPVLLCAGWPGVALEFLDLVPLLTEPGDAALQAFDVIVPSVPGFAFSTPLAGGGWSTDRVARTFVEWMSVLGYSSYVVQGGDYGAGVAPAMGRLDPDHCTAIHVNGSIGAPFQEPGEEEQKRCTETELDRYWRVAEFMDSEFGYISIQSTRPQLIGAALTDSPIGQLSWMLDKFRAWTYPIDAEPDGALGRNRILAYVTLYRLTRSGYRRLHRVRGRGWGLGRSASKAVATGRCHHVCARHRYQAPCGTGVRHRALDRGPGSWWSFCGDGGAGASCCGSAVVSVGVIVGRLADLSDRRRGATIGRVDPPPTKKFTHLPAGLTARAGRTARKTLSVFRIGV